MAKSKSHQKGKGPEEAKAAAIPAAVAEGQDPVEKFEYQNGSMRPFLLTTPSKELSTVRSASTVKDKVYLVLLAAVGLLVRLRSIASPDSVVFDEVHFGGFAKKYIKGTFFLDVHPPLVKMMYAGIASLAGFKGDFDFEKIGDVYPESTPYVVMRSFPALLGVGTAILVFLTLKASGVRPTIAFLAALMFIVENSYVTISRFILLDSPLIFFIAASVYGYKRLQNEVPYNYKWYRALISTSVALGLAASSKWSGLFTVAWIGLLNVFDLWFILGDLTVPVCKTVKQASIRGSFLLGIPFLLYLMFFAIHFNLLNKEGDGSAFMSSAFRASLEGNKIPKNIQENVGVGSLVTIRHIATQGGYLHSHDSLYETGSKQQQVTLYPHLDSNNVWEVELYNVSEAPTSFEQIHDGTKIRLKHHITKKRLHSHDHKPPVSEHQDWQKEVSGYGYDGFGGDPNDDFVVEIQKKYTEDVDAQGDLKALKSVFRLRHAMTGCYLFSHDAKLPEWGFKQQEVTCATQGVVPKSLWYIETNENKFLPADAKRVNYPVLSLWDKFVESHKRMWNINKNLNAPHAWESSPHTWPFLTRGINYWGSATSQVHFMGNAPIWWATSVIIFGFSVYVVVEVLKWHLGVAVESDKHVFNFNIQIFQFIVGWAVHYFPSFFMGRQMFLHHYLPAYYFGILALAQFLDILVSYVFSKTKPLGYSVSIVLLLVAARFFVFYSPLIYGTNGWTKETCEAAKLLSTWDFDCNKYR